MVVLVTGAGGFIGRETVRRLVQRGHEVRALVRRPAEPPLAAGAAEVMGDVTDGPRMAQVMAGCDVCVHCAGVISVKKRNAECLRVNAEGTQNVLAACQMAGARAVVVSSVDALSPQKGERVTEPDAFRPEAQATDYGKSKALCGQMALDSEVHCAVLLPSAVIGPEDYKGGLVTDMLKMYAKGLPPVSVGGGFDFVDVRDVAAAAVAAAERPRAAGCYLITGHYATVTQIFDLMAKKLGRRKTAVTFPVWLLYPCVPLVQLIWGLMKKQPPLSFSAVKLLANGHTFCHDRAQRELDYRPRPLGESVEAVAEWLAGEAQ